MDSQFKMFIFLILGFGGACGYISCILVNMNNIKDKHHGKFMAIQTALGNTGLPILTAIYGYFFVDGHKEDPENQDLEGYFFVVFIISVTICLLIVTFLREYSHEDISSADKEAVSKHETTELSSLVQVDNSRLEDVISQEDVWDFQLLTYLDYHLIIWAAMFTFGGSMMMMTNLSIVAYSWGFGEYSTALTTFASSINMVARIPMGILSDIMAYKIPRVVFIMIANVTLILMFFSCHNYFNLHNSSLIIRFLKLFFIKHLIQ